MSSGKQRRPDRGEGGRSADTTERVVLKREEIRPILTGEELQKLVGSDRPAVYSVVPVYFQRLRRTQYFYTGSVRVKDGDMVIVDAPRGPNFGQVVGMPVRTLSDGQEYQRLQRVMTPDEVARLPQNRKREREAALYCKERAAELRLSMNVVDVEMTAGMNKAIFYFTAEQRVDFRDLVKELARGLRMTIEMRQIGARDETRVLGGMGPCGIETCCSTHLSDFAPVSIKMAKNQGIALNPQKVSGLCGRLFCCLAYEDPVYTELKKGIPRDGTVLRTPEGMARVADVDIFRRTAKMVAEGRDPAIVPLDKLAPVTEDEKKAFESDQQAVWEKARAAEEARREGRQAALERRQTLEDAARETRRREREKDAAAEGGQDGGDELAPQPRQAEWQAERHPSPRPPERAHGAQQPQRERVQGEPQRQAQPSAQDEPGQQAATGDDAPRKRRRHRGRRRRGRGEGAAGGPVGGLPGRAGEHGGGDGGGGGDDGGEE
jgi:cell fate regulator YaaT (PSP1 superfamily)